jgi:hypothetical protein
MDRRKKLIMINHEAIEAMAAGRKCAISGLDATAPAAPWCLPCTVSSPSAAFAARLSASDSLAEAVFSHMRSLDARPQGTGFPWSYASTIR